MISQQAMLASESNTTFVFAYRGATLDLAREDGEKAPCGTSSQHGEVPMCSDWQPNADAPLAQTGQTVSARRPHGRLQGNTHAHNISAILPLTAITLTSI